MATNKPSCEALLNAVQHLLKEQVIPQVDGHTAYHCKIAINVLKMVSREIALTDAHETQELERLANLLANESLLTDDNTPLASLNEQLCAHIRGGDLALENSELINHLKQTTLEKLAIDNPNYSTYLAWASSMNQNSAAD